MRIRQFLPIFVLVCGAACTREEPAAPEPEAAAPVDRAVWWTRATQHPSGKERILAPRELRGLLADGQRFGFDADAEWWGKRRAWIFQRILGMDPDDLEANAATGRRTLQSIAGFARLWERMILARVSSDTIEALLDRYDGWVQDRRPIFLTADEFEVARARLRDARAHLDRLDNEPGYAALQVALARVRGSVLGDYAFIHEQAGPFLVFYSARDLQRDPEADESQENERLAQRREFYRRRLREWIRVYDELLEDLRKLYPGVIEKRPFGPRTIFYQWIFAEQEWYADFTDQLHKEDPETPYRTGFFDGASGWAYLAEAQDAAKDDVSGGVRETAVYLAASQILRHWARDPEDPTINHLDRTRAYWLKEGWPAFLAARRVKGPKVGPLLARARAGGVEFPPLLRVVERRSRIDQLVYIPFVPTEDGQGFAAPDSGFTDLAWLLVRRLHDKRRGAAFERFLVSQIEGTRRGLGWFEECFGVQGTAGWKALEEDVYAGIG